ncbi:MAG: oligosaccharide flippase family protein [Prevotella sp.]
MANLKSLVKETAIYGMSSIIGRFLNYLLVPLYTAKLSAASGGYGVITNMYAYVALLFVILTYGMETTFFRYANKQEEDPQQVYSTVLKAVGSTSVLFVVLVFVFLQPLSSFMGYADHPVYVWVMFLTVAIDAFRAIPFAYLRYSKRPIKFAFLQLLNIIVTIALNLVFFLWIEVANVAYAFYINLFCSAMLIPCLWKELAIGFRCTFDSALMRRMLSYSWPILVFGIVGILNQTADKILFPYVYRGAHAHEQLGIYGAASKIAMIMAMITQAFRYAYEPFVFGRAKDKDSKETYANAMKYFIIFTLLAYLAVMGYMDILKYIIGSDYWSGLRVVPIVMAAEIMMGVYFNLSFWYKLTDRTIWGAVFSGIGCAVLIGINVIFVPQYGYMACAWGGFAGYAIAMVLSYVVGQKYYPIDYPLQSISIYVIMAILISCAMVWANACLPTWAALIVNTLLIAVFAVRIVRADLPLSSFPVIGKRFRQQK